jgi:LPXTG-site transpeptidase (sortase) family protein
MRGEQEDRRVHRAARRLGILVAAVAFAGVLTLSGCSHRTAALVPADVGSSAIAATPSPSETPVGSATAAAASTATTRLAPTLLSIPAIGVNSTLVTLGLAKDGTLEVPTQAMTAGWYTGSPVPGLVGPSVIAGHVHWSGIPAVFAHLADLKAGDRVIVSLSDATTVIFAVDRVATYPKTQFPTELVYGDIAYPGLRLITCGGYDPVAKAYEANVIVFATRVTT